jgi:endonuclease/exonuclease/phosphatase (EEP) superfamily protein YafD
MVLLWAGLVVAAALLGVRWVDNGALLAAVLQSVVPLSGTLVVVLFVIAALTRRWRITVAAGVLLAVCITLAVPTVISQAVAPGRQDLVVMSANLEFGRADAQALVTAARQLRADVLVMEEITPAAVERLRAAGLETLLPEAVGQTRTGAGGTIVRSRLPMTLVESGVDSRQPPQAFNQPVVSIHASSGDVLLRAVHTLPPQVSHPAASWRSTLAELEAWRERQSPDLPLVMAGDFNSSFGHPGFRQIAETMTDAHYAAGEGWVRTWPQGRRLIRPFIQLDHVLTRGIDVVEAGLVHLPNTDHAAVWARLSLRPDKPPNGSSMPEPSDGRPRPTAMTSFSARTADSA